jgi:hypothetical protein
MGITCGKNFFLEFLGNVVPVPNLKIYFFFGFRTDNKSEMLVFYVNFHY